MKRRVAAMLGAGLVAWAGAQTLAHEGHGEPRTKAISTERHPWGREGDPAKATRTIAVDMADTMRFTPSALKVKRGETVTFALKNSGQVMHEMVIGTERELRAHAELMKKHPGMEHEAPYMAHVAPGKDGSITWTFDRAGTFMYGCLVPGHWEAGMKGKIVVAD